MYRTYLAAAQRLGLSDDASGYWELHIKEDERHGRQMVEDVAVKLVDMCAPGLSLGSGCMEFAVLAELSYTDGLWWLELVLMCASELI